MNIVLTGFMATGKTEISKALCTLTDRKYIDTDQMIENAEGISINEIFAQYGEEYFRKAEKEAVKKAASEKNAVIATGGGVVLDKENIDILRKSSVIINLHPDFEVIKERLKKASATRPLLQNQSIEDVRKRFDARLPFYANCDEKVHIVSGKTPLEFAKEILEIMKKYE